MNENSPHDTGRKRSYQFPLCFPGTKRAYYNNVEEVEEEEEEVVPAFISAEKIEDAELQRRADQLVVPPPFTRTQEEYTPENRILLSCIRYRDFGYTFRHAFNAFVSSSTRDQWRDMSFSVNGIQYDVINVLFTLPTHAKRPLFPSYSRDHKHVPYSAREHPVLRLTDVQGRHRDIVLDIGLLPVMLNTVLCNLHESNRERDTNGGVPVQLTCLESNLPEEGDYDETRELERRAFFRRHNESTTDHIPRFIVGGMEQVGISFDKQRNSVKQIITETGRRPYIRFISIGNKTANTIVFSNDNTKGQDKKKYGSFQALQVHISDFMRNNMNDNYINLLIPFILCGWTYERVLDELRNFVSLDETVWQRVLLELEVTHEELKQISDNWGIKLEELIRFEMRERRNPITNRMFTPHQVRRMMMESMFPHMNRDYPKSGPWGTAAHDEVHNRKLRLLLMMLSDLLMHNFGSMPATDRDCWSRKKLVSIVGNLKNLHMRHLMEVRRQWIRFSQLHPIVDIFDVDEVSFVQGFLERYDMTRTFERSMTGKSWGVFLPTGQCKPMALQCHEKLRRESLCCSISQANRTRKPVNPQVRESKSRDYNQAGDGVVCGLETPDGLQVGLAEHKTTTSMITIHVEDWPIILLVRSRNHVRNLPEGNYNVSLLVNGKFLGWCMEELEFELVRMKRTGIIDIYATIVLVHEPRPVLYVATDEGRVVYPVMVVDETTGEVLMDRVMPEERDFMKLLRAGMIEYIDSFMRLHKHVSFDRKDLVERTKQMVVNRNRSVTRLASARDKLDMQSWRSVAYLATCERAHSEILRYSRIHFVKMDPSTQLGVSASIAPVVQKNNAVRAGFGAGFFKQGIGSYVSNPRARRDVSARVLAYGSAPGNP
jgi:DNA-directed RNA polymerase beta subunit